MNINERNRYNMFLTVRQFGSENAADFPAGSIGATQFAEVNTVIDLIGGRATEQSGGASETRQGYLNKDTARENAREAMKEISRTARSMEYQFPGISTKFRMPRNRNDQELIAAGWAFAEDAVQYQNGFVDYGLPTDFIEDLTADLQAFQDSFDVPAAGIGEQVAATAEIGSLVRRGMIAVRVLNGVIKNKYRDNVGKLAAWATASHIERTPKSAPTQQPVS
jgi:hypothetical protein